MLRKLVREGLFHAHYYRRELASNILLASPYAHAVADAALEVTSQWDSEVAGRAWGLARRLGHALTPQRVTERVLAETRPELQRHALACLAWSRDAMTDQLARHTARVARGPAQHRGSALAAVAALGMYRRQDLLDGIEAPEMKEAAKWWRTAGGAIHES